MDPLVGRRQATDTSSADQGQNAETSGIVVSGDPLVRTCAWCGGQFAFNGKGSVAQWLGTSGRRPQRYCSNKCARASAAQKQRDTCRARREALYATALPPCRQCGQPLKPRMGRSPSEYVNGGGKTKTRVFCSMTCQKAWMSIEAAAKAEKALATRKDKKCPACGLVVPISGYYVRRDGKPGSYCRKCTAERGFETRSRRDPYITSLVNSARVRARKKDRSFDITTEWVNEQAERQNWLCYYTGRQMTTQCGSGRLPTNMSLDRVDSSRGYTQDNVVLCCTDINIAKQQYPIEHLLELARMVAAWRAASVATNLPTDDEAAGTTSTTTWRTNR